MAQIKSGATSSSQKEGPIHMQASNRPMVWVGPKVIPDKARHPDFPHVQSIEDAEHTDPPRACCKTEKIMAEKP